jgi:hypothetical protein
MEANNAWAPQKWINQVFLSFLFAKNGRLHYVEKGTSAHSLLQSYSRFNKQLVKSKLILTILSREIHFSNERLMREVVARINRQPTITSPAFTTFVRVLLSMCYVRFVKKAQLHCKK